MTVPIPTPILRFIHVDNLPIYLQRGGMHAPNHTPKDSFAYRTIHNVNVQAKRHHTRIPCGPRGTVHGYVPFYFGPLSPMMLNLKTGRVPGYTGGQGPLIYLVSTCQAVQQAGIRFVFSDGHGIAVFTHWFDDLGDLAKVDWQMVNERYWADNVNDMDRQRRKQAEFLVHEFCPWSLVEEIAVIDAARKRQVEGILGQFSTLHQPVVIVRRNWYY